MKASQTRPIGFKEAFVEQIGVIETGTCTLVTCDNITNFHRLVSKSLLCFCMEKQSVSMSKMHFFWHKKQAAAISFLTCSKKIISNYYLFHKVHCKLKNFIRGSWLSYKDINVHGLKHYPGCSWHISWQELVKSAIRQLGTFSFSTQNIKWYINKYTVKP